MEALIKSEKFLETRVIERQGRLLRENKKFIPYARVGSTFDDITDRLTLLRNHTEVGVATSWGQIFWLGNYQNRTATQVEFEKFSNQLLNGAYKVKFTSPAQAEIIKVDEPEDLEYIRKTRNLPV